MRILHFLPVYIPAWKYGGPILSVSRLCEGLVAEGLDVRVITTNAGLPDFPSDQLGIPQDVNGVTVFYYQADKNMFSISSKELLRALPDHISWAQLLHLSSIWQPLGLPIQAAAHNAGLPVIQSLRGALGPYSWRHGWWKKVPYFLFWERPILQKAAALQCTTSQEMSETTWLGLRSPLELLPNSVDLTRLRLDPLLGSEWLYSKSLSRKETTFIVLGRIHNKKGLDLLPSAMKHLSHHPWKLIFVGDDSDGSMQRLKRDFRRVGLENRCFWFSSLPSDELAGPYNAADWLLLPSYHENFGNVVVEALACGCGVVASNSVGVANDLVDCPGVFVVGRSQIEWTQVLLHALNSHKPGSASTKYVHERYNHNTVAKSAVSIYSRYIRPSNS